MEERATWRCTEKEEARTTSSSSPDPRIGQRVEEKEGGAAKGGEKETAGRRE